MRVCDRRDKAMAEVFRALITGRQERKVLILVNSGDQIATMQNGRQRFES